MRLNGLEKYFETIDGEIIDFKQINTGYTTPSTTPLLFALSYNKEKELNLNNEQFEYLIKNSDLKHIDASSGSSLMYALKNNKTQNLNLNNEQLNYLINNSDLKQVDEYGFISLMYALKYNKEENLNLNNNQLGNLIYNSNLKNINENGYNPLIYALIYNESQNLNLTNEQWIYIIDNSDSDLYLIKQKPYLIELKKIQSELLNDKILAKIDIEENNKILKKI